MSIVKADIEAINSLSKQLLSEINIQRVSAKSELAPNEQAPVAETLAESTSSESKELGPLTTKRHSLIVALFNAYTQTELHDELTLINEMVLLDRQLTLAIEGNKNALAEQVITIKKSKKINKLYKKY